MMKSQKLTNKTLVLVGYGGYDKLKIEEKPIPRPAEGEVVVHIHASGINFAELMCRQGTYDRTPKCPAVLGLEGSGVVSEVGPGVNNVKAGQRVLCMKDFGLWREFAVICSTQCFPIPDKMSFAEAAALPLTYVTAHMMLFEMSNLRPHRSVLIHMAAGGVGTAATQLCQTVDDVTVFGTASASKHEAIRKIGVTHPIDYRTEDYVKRVREISPDGVDIVLDPMNGADAWKGYQLLKPMGKIVHFGASNVVSGPKMSLWNLTKTWWQTTSYNPLWRMGDNRVTGFFHLGHVADRPEIWSDTMKQLIELYSQGKIKPTIDSVWDFEDVGKAMARMHERQNVGKVIISPDKSLLTTS